MKNYVMLSLILLIACGSGTSPAPDRSAITRETTTDTSFIHYVNRNSYPWLRDSTEKHFLREHFAPPPGTQRMPCEPGSFADWLRHIPLLAGKPPVLLYDGSEKGNQDVHEAVVNIDVGSSDLQQCADAVIRLRAEYLYSLGKFGEISFNYTSGHSVRFSDWAKGIRPVVKGNTVQFVPGNRTGSDRENFGQYLKSVFTYAGSLSLSKELHAVPLDSINGGDVFVIGGSPGHAVIVMDIARNEKGERFFMLAQSYMPAQQIHVLKNPKDKDISPWYSVKATGEILYTPEWNFGKSDLKRF